MTIQIAIVPTETDTPHYDQTAILSGKEYLMGFRYNSREGTWHIVLSDTDGLICSLKCTPKVDLLAPYKYNERLPPGALYIDCVNADDDSPPDLGELGNTLRCVLYYASVVG